jgi:hypothetical protein
MPRYLVQRAFREGLRIPINDEGAAVCGRVVGSNAEEGVTWVHSYVSEDKTRTFCIYDAPSPEAIRKTAAINQLPLRMTGEETMVDHTHIKRSDAGIGAGGAIALVGAGAAGAVAMRRRRVVGVA